MSSTHIVIDIDALPPELRHLVAGAVRQKRSYIWIESDLSDDGSDEEVNCSQNGVMAPVVGIIGSVQALETIKMICGIGESLVGRLLLLDAKTMQWREMKLPRDTSCEACSSRG